MRTRAKRIAESEPYEEYRTRLREERNRLRIALSTAEDRIRDLKGIDASQLDDPVPDCDCEYLMESYNRQRERLKSVVESLERIEERTFGLCVACSRPIGQKRLEVLPSAQYCLSCQEELEHSGPHVVPSAAPLLLASF